MYLDLRISSFSSFSSSSSSSSSSLSLPPPLPLSVVGGKRIIVTDIVERMWALVVVWTQEMEETTRMFGPRCAPQVVSV